MKKLFLIPVLMMSLQLFAQTGSESKYYGPRDFIKMKPTDQNPTVTLKTDKNGKKDYGVYDFIRVKPTDQNPVLVIKQAFMNPNGTTVRP
ncbi:MAG: hypothetical protein V2A54_03800 [Bacteroidota bacterium]